MSDPFIRLSSALQGRYRVERVLGEGGMATVYLAEDVKHRRRVALKVLKPELAAVAGADRFLREITLTARLDHPHILPLLDSGEAGGLLYYAMPYVEGESLRERLTRERQLALEDAIRITVEVADALSYAHARGVLHRDIKPENILLAGGHARVADFGIARALSGAGAVALTEIGLAIGTPLYVSPEQASGEAEVDGRTDVYALGCVAYEMLVGQPPYTGATPAAILARKATETPASIRVVRDAVPHGIERAILRALARVPADRFQTTAQFAEALERGHDVPRPLALTTRPVPRRRALFVGATLVAVAAAAWWSTQRGQSPPEIRSLAVLPLRNLGDASEEYFVAGMHEVLTTELSRLGTLSVISRTSAVRYRDSPLTLPEIARELGVEGLVEGSVLRDGDEVRITVRLIHGPSDRHLWAGTYQRELRDVLALQGEVAGAIATQMRLSLTPEEVTRLASARQVDAAAYEEYLRGLHEWNKLSVDGWLAAIDYFDRSIGRDPTYAPPHAMQSLAHTLLAYYSRMPPAVLYSRALTEAERAVGLDSALAEARAALSLVSLTFDWEWAVADRESQEALRLNPNSTIALVTRAFYLSWMGRHDEAIPVAREAVELDPVTPWTRSWLSAFLFMARRYDEAIEEASDVLAIESRHVDAQLWLCYSYVKKGMFDEALRTSRSLGGGIGGWIDAWVLASAGRRAEASRLLAETPTLQSPTPTDGYFFAIPLGALGERDRAFAYLEQAYQGRSALMSVLKVDPRIDALRDDSRFAELLQRMSFPN